MTTPHSVVLWAQRQSKVMLTLQQQDIQEFTITQDTPETLTINYKTEGEEHSVPLKLYAGVDAESKHVNATGRQLEITVDKVEESWWPRLLSDTAKYPWVKVDFNKWVDEDDEEAAAGESNENDFQMDGMDADYRNLLGDTEGAFQGEGEDDEEEEENADAENVEASEVKDKLETDPAEVEASTA